METKADIIQRNENAPPKGNWMEREYVKRSTAVNCMTEFAQQMAVAFFDWARNKDPKLTANELYMDFSKEIENQI